ncbi:serpin H1b [Xyrauchen texanus]|uniref:serpin H1b n=1 Tax=Xyrauchen texanus TaxID=154827 RepID=UPI0022429759|nr:serpin H1b [Xyrauchen texanus]XP_051963695.1 serpin H1b [Xyrauchen texanus]XP_051963696.1 serpin H1b [Xyrauchen texanus]XP_051963697.1 serpin H1b [Xyrauchen texanus]XP_051963698.1 serpin H1b [Xyrauchen texanus]
MWVSKLIALCLLAVAVSGKDNKLSSHATSMADTSMNLAFNLYHNVAKEKNLENILISPVVVASSLGMVAMGGKSSTASQVKSLLKADALKDDHLHTGLSELLSEVSNPQARNVTWKISNRLYGPSSVSFAEDFVKNSKKHYNYEHSKINFRDKRSTINSINEWAAKSTDGKVPEVTKDVKNTDGAMIVNAMFFKPHWDEKFHNKMVDNRGFLVTRSYTVSVPMMHRTGIYGFYEDKENKLFVLDMPLAHKKSSMIFIMPYHVEPLERLEKLLTRQQLDTWISKLEERAVAISLPKVSMEVSHDLQKHLGEIGLTEAVDKSKADLSNISGKKDLYLANVFHASAFEWDTEGNPFDTSVYGSEKMRNPKLFYADHPFIFLVKDKKTNSVLFIGRLVRPKGDKIKDEL